MNSIEITRTNGNIPKALPNNDHVSALVYFGAENNEILEDADYIACVSSADELLEFAEQAFDKNRLINMFHAVGKQFFAMNPSALLWVGVSDTKDDSFIEKMQKKASGEIRQMGVLAENFFDDNVSAFNAITKKLESENMPLSLIVADLASLYIEDFTGNSYDLPLNERISIVLAEESGYISEFIDSVPVLGYVLGAVSAAKVNESISWVRKFPVPVSEPMIYGTPISEINQAVLDVLDQKGFIFLRSYTGLNGYYFNDSRTMADPTSDYNTIESVRTMDKAVRGIRTYLLPELGAPLKLDPETGCLAPETVKYLETVASQQLTAMEKAGEISGWSVEIDPAQNVLATSTVEFVIKNVPIGVMRKASVKIGYAQSV